MDKTLPETLIGTSFCEQSDCPTCISRTRCVTLTLIDECRIIAKFLGKSPSELFPSLEILYLLIFKEGDYYEKTE